MLDEKLQSLYDRLDRDGQSAFRETYPEHFVERFPESLNEAYDYCGGLSTLRLNVPINAAARLTAFAHLLVMEAAMNKGEAGSLTVGLRGTSGDGDLVALYQMPCDGDPMYRLPIYLGADQMIHLMRHFPDTFKALFS